MPIFDYRCSSCSAIYDIFHKGKELDGDIICPNCGSHQYTKLISLPGIISKGISPVNCSQRGCEMERSCCGDRCPLD